MKLLAALLTITFVCQLSHQAVFNANNMVDEHLIKVRVKAREEGKEAITIPNVSKQWDERVAFFKVTCRLDCEGGWVKNMSTIRRAGDVTVRSQGEKLILNLKMRFDEVAAHYDWCRIEAKRLGRSTRKLEISTTDIIVDGQATLVHDGVDCDLSIDRVYVESMGELRFDVGGSLFQRLESRVYEALADHFRDEVREILGRNLETLLRDAIGGEKVCEKLEF